MPAAEVPLWVAVVGPVATFGAALGGTWIGGRSALRVEERRWARDDEATRRSAVDATRERRRAFTLEALLGVQDAASRLMRAAVDKTTEDGPYLVAALDLRMAVSRVDDADLYQLVKAFALMAERYKDKGVNDGPDDEPSFGNQLMTRTGELLRELHS